MASRPTFLALGLYAAISALFLVTTAPERLTSHTPYNHYALLAEAWTRGRLDLGGPPPAHTGNNDFAVHDGKFYVSFPPFPAVLLVPMVKAAGSAAHVRDGQLFVWLAGVGPAVFFLALEKLAASGRSRRSPRENVMLAALFALGTVYWFTSVQGTVWFAAHVVGVALCALFLLFAIDAAHPMLAGLALGLAFATRPPMALMGLFFLCEAWRAARADLGPAPRYRGVNLRALGVRLAQFALPAAAVVAVLLWHNDARFGDPFEFGHRMLAIGWRGRIEKWGLFSYHYLGRNLAVVLTGLPFTNVAGTPFQINVHGLALWLTTPIYAWALWPRRATGLFWALGVTAAAVALPNLLYQNSGWIQFGYRFSNDFALLLFAMIAVGGRRLSFPFWLAAAAGVAVNGFGAVSFQREGFERYYFVDPTQRVLHQPD